MKKYLRFFLLMSIVLIVFTGSAFAEQQDTTASEAESVGEETLNRNIFDDGESLSQFDPISFVISSFQSVVQEYKAPIKSLGVCIGIILITAIFPVLWNKKDEHLLQTVEKAVGIGSCVFVCNNLIVYFSQSSALFDTIKNFVVGLSPIIAGVTIATGRPITAGVHHLFLTTTSAAMAQICTSVLIPILYFSMSLSIVGTFFNDGIGKTADSLRNGTMKSLVILATVFVSILSLQTLVSGAKDSVTLRTGKLLAGNFIPVVGGVLSDATSTVFSSLRVLKSTVGIGAIAAVAFTFIPTLLKGILWMITLWASSLFADFLGTSILAKLFKDLMDTVRFIVSVLFFFMVMVMIGFAVTILAGGFS